jgi:hypothetical protein
MLSAPDVVFSAVPVAEGNAELVAEAAAPDSEVDDPAPAAHCSLDLALLSSEHSPSQWLDVPSVPKKATVRRGKDMTL